MLRPKSRIEPRRQNTHQITVDADKLWSGFANAVTQIHNNNVAHLNYEENYRCAYNLCVQKHGGLLYDGVCGLIKENLHRMAKEFIIPAFPTGEQGDPSCKSKEGERFLQSFCNVWKQHIRNMSMLRDLLKYMDRTHVPNNNLMPIYEVGLDLFIKELLQGNVQETIIRVILDLIHLERDGYTIDRPSMKSCIDILLDLGSPSIYSSILELRILEESYEFYDTELKKWMQSSDASDCLHLISNRLLEEESRSQHYLPSITHPKIRNVIYQHLSTPSWDDIVYTANTRLEALNNEGRFASGMPNELVQLYDFLRNRPIVTSHPRFDLIDENYSELNLVEQ